MDQAVNFPTNISQFIQISCVGGWKDLQPVVKCEDFLPYNYKIQQQDKAGFYYAYAASVPA